MKCFVVFFGVEGVGGLANIFSCFLIFVCDTGYENAVPVI